MKDIAIPDDIFRPEDGQDAAIAWKSLGDQTADAMAKRTDLIGLLSIEERLGGRSGWLQRVQLRLTAEGDDSQLEPVGDKVIRDTVKVFELFRLGKGSNGYGWTRDKLAQHSVGRLRAFAQNADWCRENPEEALGLIDSGANENAVRAAIKRIKREKAEAEARARGEEVAPAEQWESIELRLDPRQARIVRAVLQGVMTRAIQTGDEGAFSEHPKVALGQAAFLMSSEWLGVTETYDDGNGGDLNIPNSSFIDAQIMADLLAEEAAQAARTEEGDDAQAEGAEAA